CWEAAGRLDAYDERGLQPWDMAAGALVAAEAGAWVGGLGGAAPSPALVIATAPGLEAAFVDLLRQAEAGAGPLPGSAEEDLGHLE
ncbi:MAG: inositol monophosphatase family protein, partial [Acidimicrobiales bacterium]